MRGVARGRVSGRHAAPDCKAITRVRTGLGIKPAQGPDTKQDMRPNPAPDTKKAHAFARALTASSRSQQRLARRGESPRINAPAAGPAVLPASRECMP